MAMSGGVVMADPLLLTVAQMRRIEPYFPLSRGIATVDNRLVIDRVTLVIANGLRWPAGALRVAKLDVSFTAIDR
jgi:hypothetical protein